MMKRLLSISFLLLGMNISAHAQDDIYYNSADIEKEKKEEKKRAEEEANQRAYEEQNYDYSASENSYDNEGNYRTYNNSYESDGDAYNDGNNDYYYATNIRRFNYPFYGMGYYNSFYNPYGYDPYWYDPYWGWSAWNRPGFSISFGSGPYWNSYWSWYSWYGYPMYNSYYYYPYYGNAYCNAYYSGYWNGYYSGLYNNNYGTRQTYGPRNSYVSNSVIHNNMGSGLRNGVRPVRGTGVNLNQNGNRNASNVRTVNEVPRTTDRNVVENPNRRFFSNDRAERTINRDNDIRMNNNDAIRGGRMQNAPGRTTITPDRNNYSSQPARVQPDRQITTPRYQRPSNNYERPSNNFQRSEPSFQRSAPVRSSPTYSAPSRGGGSNFGGGSRGGSFGGRR